MESTYITSAQKANQLPVYDEPEFAFIGRSNSGKSSLLNALLGRKGLARESSTPGRTQMVNFFMVKPTKERSLIFADLPGYGFNVANKSIKKLWGDLIPTYFERKNIKAVLFLIDARRNIEAYEIEYLRELSVKHPLWIVFTKADKLKKNEIPLRKDVFEKTLHESGIVFHSFWILSTLSKLGVPQLQKELLEDASN